jgi:hypothetical protein
VKWDHNKASTGLPVSLFLERGLEVTLRRPLVQPGLRRLGVVLLVLGLIRVPLPQADFHNIRHHHGAGEVCPHHDHLLRWHPKASQSDDVAMLHWHWFLPQTQEGGGSPASGDDENTPFSGHALHAYLADCLEPNWNADPVIRPDARGRSLQHISPGVSLLNPSSSLASLVELSVPPAAKSASSLPLAAGPRAGLIDLFQRSNC